MGDFERLRVISVLVKGVCCSFGLVRSPILCSVRIFLGWEFLLAEWSKTPREWPCLWSLFNEGVLLHGFQMVSNAIVGKCGVLCDSACALSASLENKEYLAPCEEPGFHVSPGVKEGLGVQSWGFGHPPISNKLC